MLDFFQFTRKLLACLGAVLYLRPREGGRCRGNSFKIIENGGGYFFLSCSRSWGGRKLFIINSVKSPLLGKHHISLQLLVFKNNFL